MAVIIGSNSIDSNTANIDFYANNTYVQQVNDISGRRTEYPSFHAAGTLSQWRYQAQIGGSGWRVNISLATSWAVNQRGAGGFGFNTTNGRYFAPVSGYYQFGMTVYYLDDANTNSYTHMNFSRNGGLNFNNGRHGHSIFNLNSHGSYAHGINMENIIFCDQGQYVSPAPFLNAGSQRIYMGHFHFYGHLCP
jgi:hypothetical protein